MGASRMREGAKLQFARHLRREMTDAERHLWRHLRLKQIDGHRFRRQHPVGPYIVDFVCIERGLVVEVDGGQHAMSTSDPLRNQYLETQGLATLRFWNHDVLGNIDGVIAVLRDTLASVRPHPSLPPRAGEGAKGTIA